MPESNRRGFLKNVAAGTALAAQVSVPGQAEPAPVPQAAAGAGGAAGSKPAISYPRKYSGAQLAAIAYPLGGIGTGTISLGGRGQLRDFEVFNRPDKGRVPQIVFPAIWAKVGTAAPVARVLETQIPPPYTASSGVGGASVPGLSRMEDATFTGEFPKAKIEFHDPHLPVQVTLDAFSPFIPGDPDSSGYPVAVLRYRVKNPARTRATVSIVFTLENPITMEGGAGGRGGGGGNRRGGANGSRENEFRTTNNSGVNLQGFYMANPGMPENDTQRGTFALCLLNPGDGRITHLNGWQNARWSVGPTHFWDDFEADGELNKEQPGQLRPAASLCMQREIAAGAEAEYTFLLAWHFPNRTPAGCGWSSPQGMGDTVIGNYYCTRFADAWAAAEALARRLPELEKRTDAFLETMRNSTLPGAVRDAAMSNLSTLVTQTSFRTADGNFHGFEGSNDRNGCCFGNCLHVWNYETATQYVFPTLARSLRNAAFGYSEDENGAMRFRQMLPDGSDRFGWAATDGQMGQIIKIYMDWRLSGDTDWLRSHWPAVKKAMEFAWVQGGWDANRDGVMEGVQHNTYDIEFFGPNPECGIYYLGALRAAEEMARVLGDPAASEYRAVFEKGRAWIDQNLFNGEYYKQIIRGIPKSDIAPAITGDMGASDTEHPDFQLGDGCLADQLIGQYLADLAALGPLLDPAHIRKTLESIYKYNHKADLNGHDTLMRVYALNDEAALLIADYTKGGRPETPFPYWSEAWTGIEYLVAAQFIHAGMLREGYQVAEDVRNRYDGERRNPWDEPECGHHYARAMSSWSMIVAASGFDYHAPAKALALVPPGAPARLNSFWSAGAGWGSFNLAGNRAEITAREGSIALKTIRLARVGSGNSSVMLNGRAIPHHVERANGGGTVVLDQDVVVPANGTLVISA